MSLRLVDEDGDVILEMGETDAFVFVSQVRGLTKLAKFGYEIDGVDWILFAIERWLNA